MVTGDTPAPPFGINPGTATAARMYDYWLGGHDHFAADRIAALEVAAVAPEAPVLARQNRAFLGRAVRYLAGEVGIGQPGWARDRLHAQTGPVCSAWSMRRCPRRCAAVDAAALGALVPEAAVAAENPPVSRGAVDAGQDVGLGRCLRLELPPDHRDELIERLQDREVQVAKEIRREHQTAVSVDRERFHASPSGSNVP